MLNGSEIEKQLNLADEKINVQVLKSVSSTNDVVKEMFIENSEKVSLAATNKQTAGRGRGGKSFYSDLDKGLYFSFAFQPKETALENLPLYTIAAATALVQILENYVNHPVSIKWVNDIFYQGRKVSGILSETITEPASNAIKGIIIGIGINFAGDFASADHNAQEVAGTLFGKKVPDNFNQNLFLAEFLERFFDIHEHIEEKNFMTIYRDHLLGMNKEVHYTVAGNQRVGIIRGIDEHGFLLIETPDNKIEKLYGQEIHFGSSQFLDF